MDQNKLLAKWTKRYNTAKNNIRKSLINEFINDLEWISIPRIESDESAMELIRSAAELLKKECEK